MARVTLLPRNRILQARPGETLHSLLAREGLLDAPCGGQGTCGKCRIWADGEERPACQTDVTGDMTVILPEPPPTPLGKPKRGAALAFDIGTTTLVCSLLDGKGFVVNRASAPNPQRVFGADVVTRIRAALGGQEKTMTAMIRAAMTDLIRQICKNPEELQTVCVVGNPTMQQLFLGLFPENLARIPYEPLLKQPEVTDCAPCLPICPNARLLTVPDISGFVGADTVAGILSCGMQDREELTLLVDIGTNGEIVLGNRERMVACATAAGPALEGANISCGMRAEPGAIEQVWVEDGQLRFDVIGDGEPRGICGSGLIDALAAALNLGLLNRRGRICNEQRRISLTEGVFLTQEDIRQLQLAKGAIAAGIRLLVRELGVELQDIGRVVLAGAFGTVLDPGSACRIGLLPEELLEKATALGNTAGDGACLLAADPGLLETTRRIVGRTEYLDLSTHPAFPRTFAKATELPENWVEAARALGFSGAVPLDPATLHPRMHGYSRGILLQTVGTLSKTIDSRGYRETERRHLEAFSRMCQALRRQYPEALCLGTGGCRICKTCAHPQPCRFPEQAVSSMEGYGLFVTQVCRDAGLPYHHGEKTITYTACILYGRKGEPCRKS